MDYLIRNVARSDLDALVRLCQKHAAYEHAEYKPEGKRDLLDGALFAASPALSCLVVESGQAVVGYASYTVDYSTWDAAYFLHMDCLYLEPTFRGYGIGGVIIERLKGIARQQECVGLQWQTPTFNEPAIDFYHRIGARSKEKMRFFIDL